MARRQARVPREHIGFWEVVDARILLSLVTGLLLAVAISWGAKWLLAPDTLPLRAIEVEGDFRKVDAKQIRDALNGVELGGLFSVDVGEVRDLTESLPWVEHVTVTRKWPDTLRLSVFEHHAVAHWGEGSLLDKKAQRFSAEPESFPDGLPKLDGPDGQEEAVLKAYRDMSQMLKPVGLGIARLTMDARRAWQVKLDNGIELLLGRQDRERQLLRFVHVYPQSLAARSEGINRIDLRYTNGFAVEWKKGARRAARETAYV
ncbi:MAG: cell division protein FtsQ/DivIB [Gammaproteobacteria bacterium]|nr:cell division protein FtsQ/DivIB [Gammaproteobacteria bacterium]